MTWRILRGQEGRVPRQNVVFELGLFMGKLGRQRVFVVTEADAELPSDFDGMTTASIQGDSRALSDLPTAVAPACFHIRQAIEAQEKKASASAWGAGPRSLQQMQVYGNVGELGFIERVGTLIDKSREIIFIGTGLNVLDNGRVRQMIVDRTRTGALNATICFGNPYAPQVRARLTEEERGVNHPTIAVEGIISRTRAMIQTAENNPNLKVLLFNNYPTMSIFSFDRKEFVYYPMGCRKLGNECPAFFAQKPGIVADFLEEMIGNFVGEAVEAREVFRVGHEHKRSKEFVNPSEMRAVAIYAIPRGDDPFYRLGSRLLGYDVLNSVLAPQDPDLAEFRDYVGDARDYGLHVTIADVMYVPANQVPIITSELRAIAGGIGHFELKAEKVATSNEFGKNSVVLVCSDESGELEKLAAEVAVRLRPQALGTNYTLDPRMLHGRGRLSRRDEVMLKVYQSPFVFNRYTPHFTLALPSRTPLPGETKRLARRVEQLFEPFLNGQPIPIECVYVLERPLNEPRWTQRHEIGLH